MLTPDCLPQRLLLRYQLGDLPKAAMETAAEHLQTCRECLDALAKLDHASDPMLLALRRNAGQPETPSGQAYRLALAKAIAKAIAEPCSPPLLRFDPKKAARLDPNYLPPPRPRRLQQAALGLAFLALVISLGILSAPWVRSTPQVSAASSAPPLGKLPMTLREAQELQQRWSTFLGVPMASDNSLGMAFVLIPPGELPTAHGAAASLRPLEMSSFETTVGQFAAFAQASGYRTEAEQAHAGPNWQAPALGTATPSAPATHLSLADANAFCAWLSKKEGRRCRLPSAAEFEWAARAGCAAAYPEAPEQGKLEQHAWLFANSKGRPRPVGQLRANAWGLHDLLGNAAERLDDGRLAGGCCLQATAAFGLLQPAAAELKAVGFRVVREAEVTPRPTSSASATTKGARSPSSSREPSGPSWRTASAK